MLLRTFTQNARMIGHLRKEPQLIYYTPLQPKVDPVQLTTFDKNNQGKTPSSSDTGLEILYTLYKPL